MLENSQRTIDQSISRRECVGLVAMLAGASLVGIARPSEAATNNEQEFQNTLDQLGNDPELAAQMRGVKEYNEFFPDLQLEKAPIKIKPSNTPVSERSIDLIVRCEVTSETYYTSHYQAPTWPHGPSGITIGIGYDLGYVTEDEFVDDWKEYSSAPVRAQLKAACLKTGQEAEKLLSQYSSVKISWDPAISQFRKQALPRYVALTEVSLANFGKLSPDSRGALVSLVYNRGASFSVPTNKPNSERYEEMRAIKTLMINQQFDKIPEQIRHMKRLWEGAPNQRGNVVRRDAEAALFELGLTGK